MLCLSGARIMIFSCSLLTRREHTLDYLSAYVQYSLPVYV